MPISEVYTALQQGVVDGQDNPLSTSYYAGWYDIQKYVAITNHMYSPGYLVINKRVWERLPKATQGIVKKAALSTAAAILKAIKEQQEQIIKEITAKGVIVTYPDLKPFIERVKPINDEFLKERPELKGIFNDINKLGQKYLTK